MQKVVEGAVGARQLGGCVDRSRTSEVPPTILVHMSLDAVCSIRTRSNGRGAQPGREGAEEGHVQELGEKNGVLLVPCPFGQGLIRMIGCAWG